MHNLCRFLHIVCFRRCGGYSCGYRLLYFVFIACTADEQKTQTEGHGAENRRGFFSEQHSISPKNYAIINTANNRCAGGDYSITRNGWQRVLYIATIFYAQEETEYHNYIIFQVNLFFSRAIFARRAKSGDNRDGLHNMVRLKILPCIELHGFFFQQAMKNLCCDLHVSDGSMACFELQPIIMGQCIQIFAF